MVAFALRTEDTPRREMAESNVFGEYFALRDCAKRFAGVDTGDAPVVLERGQAFGRHGHRKRLEFADTDLEYSDALHSPRLPHG